MFLVLVLLITLAKPFADPTREVTKWTVSRSQVELVNLGKHHHLFMLSLLLRVSEDSVFFQVGPVNLLAAERVEARERVVCA